MLLSAKHCKAHRDSGWIIIQSSPRVYVSSAWISALYISSPRQDTNQQQNRRSDAFVNPFVKVSFTATTSERSEEKHFGQNFSQNLNNLKNWNHCNMSESRVIEFVCRLENAECTQWTNALVYCVHSALTPVRLVAYWLNGVTNWVDREVTHWLMGDSKGFRTHAMHGSFKL